MAKTIKLNRNEFENIIRESVKRIIFEEEEYEESYDDWYFRTLAISDQIQTAEEDFGCGPVCVGGTVEEGGEKKDIKTFYETDVRKAIYKCQEVSGGEIWSWDDICVYADSVSVRIEKDRAQYNFYITHDRRDERE